MCNNFSVNVYNSEGILWFMCHCLYYQNLTRHLLITSGYMPLRNRNQSLKAQRFVGIILRHQFWETDARWSLKYIDVSVNHFILLSNSTRKSKCKSNSFHCRFLACSTHQNYYTLGSTTLHCALENFLYENMIVKILNNCIAM